MRSGRDGHRPFAGGARRHGNAIILEPIAEGWGWLDALTGDVDTDFAAATSKQPDQQARAGLDEILSFDKEDAREAGESGPTLRRRASPLAPTTS